jgi:hypothetical protein
MLGVILLSEFSKMRKEKLSQIPKQTKEGSKMKMRITLARFFLLGVVLSVSAPGKVAAQEQACIFRSVAYGVGAIECFDKIEHECASNNSWVVRGTCTAENPTGGTPVDGLPEAMDGPLCLAGTYYSPTAERCNGGRYQVCNTSTQWADRNPPAGFTCN